MPNSFERAWRKRFEGFATYSEDDAGIAGWSPTGLATRLRQFTCLWEKASSSSGCGWMQVVVQVLIQGLWQVKGQK
ncbi:MAG: hypothetical protein OEX82_02430 [Nitrosomonas sp.]|nr:hypothetical protein [Nitrosomonas sp.]